MPAPWFLAPPEAWQRSEIALPEEESHHALRVLRVAPPDVIAITDGGGRVARCAAVRVDDGRLVAEILDIQERRAPRPRLAVYQGAAKGNKLDAVIEKLAELGVAEVTVFHSERAVVRWGEDKQRRLTDRWSGIARSAAKQSRNPYVMKVEGGLSFPQLLRRVAREPVSVTLWEEATLPLRTALIDMADRLAVIVGPEGGLTPQEADALADAGSQVVTLGPLILRTENAAVVTAAAVLYHYGLIG